MEIIDFKAGAQVISGPIVRDINGLLWKVLKPIANATAQPREGAYYTRYLEPVPPPEPAVDYKALYDQLAVRLATMEQNKDAVIAIDFNVNPNDFYLKEVLVNGVQKFLLSIKR